MLTKQQIDSLKFGDWISHKYTEGQKPNLWEVIKKTANGVVIAHKNLFAHVTYWALSHCNFSLEE